VNAGDILVGKCAQGRDPDDAGRKAAAAIFGEKAVDVRDTSLRAAEASPAPSSRSASSTAMASTTPNARPPLNAKKNAS
jgi:hypothetical protein